MPTIFEQLAAPFPPDRVSWRVGSTNREKTRGMALAYIDARDVMDRLDAVLGPDSWQCRYPHANGKTVCEIGLYSVKSGSGEWIWKADGAGDTDFEAEKGALSDAFKRAAVRWGIGRYLYDVAAPWVEIEPAGKSFAIKASELQRLHKLLAGAKPDNRSLDNAAIATDLIRELRTQKNAAALKKWGESNADTIAKLDEANRERVRGDYAKQLTALKNAENLAA